MIYFLQEKGQPEGDIRIGYAKNRGALNKAIRRTSDEARVEYVTVAIRAGGDTMLRDILSQCDQCHIKGRWYRYEGQCKRLVCRYDIKGKKIFAR